MQFGQFDFDVIEDAATINKLCGNCNNEATHVLCVQPYGIGIGLPFMKPLWSSHRQYVLACSICGHYEGRLSKDIAEALIRKGKEQAVELARLEQTVRQCKTATVVNPQSPQAFLQLASALDSLDRWEESLTAYERAVQLDPNNPVALGSLGVTYCNLDKWQDGLKALKESHRLEPNNQAVSFGLGQAMVHTGDKEGALQIYGQLITKNEEFAAQLLTLINA